MPQTFLLTGGTGFVGSFLGTELLKRGDKVIFLARSQSGISAEERVARVLKLVNEEVFNAYRHNIEVVEGDVTEPLLGIRELVLKDLQNKVAAIWHLAAHLGFSKNHVERSFATNVRGTQNVLGIVERLKVPLYYVSTAYIRGGDNDDVVQEDSLVKPQHFNNVYEETKFEAEKLVRLWGEKSAKNVFVIFRPSVIVGDSKTGKAVTTLGYYSFLETFYNFKKQLRFPLFFPFSSRLHLNFIPIDKVVELMLDVISYGAKNKTFHIMNLHPPSFEEIVKETFKGFNIQGYLFPAPPWFIKLYFSFLRAIALVLPSQFIKNFAKNISYFSPYILNEAAYDTTNLKKVLGAAALGNVTLPPGFFQKTIKEFIILKDKKVI